MKPQAQIVQQFTRVAGMVLATPSTRAYRGLTLEIDGEAAGPILRDLQSGNLGAVARSVVKMIDDWKRRLSGEASWWSRDHKIALRYTEDYQQEMNGDIRLPIVLTALVDEADKDPDATGFSEEQPIPLLEGSIVSVVGVSVRIPHPKIALRWWNDAMQYAELPDQSKILYPTQWVELPSSPMQITALPQWRKDRVKFWNTERGPQDRWGQTMHQIEVRLSGGHGLSPMAVVIKKPEWGVFNLHELVREATQETKAKWDDLIQKIPAIYKDAKAYLVYSGSESAIVATASYDDIRRGIWRRPERSESQYLQPDFQLYSLTFESSDEEALWDVYSEKIMRTPGMNRETHPQAVDLKKVTVYRGIGVPKGIDPTRSGNEDGFRGGGAGMSWTLRLDTAKAIAERGQAGFVQENIPGQIMKYNPKKEDQKIPTILRCEVELGDYRTDPALFEMDMAYFSEQEVNIPHDYPIIITGVMQAEPIGLDADEIDRSEKDQSKYDWQNPGYDIIWRWPQSFKSTRVERTAASDPYPLIGRGMVVQCENTALKNKLKEGTANVRDILSMVDTDETGVFWAVLGRDLNMEDLEEDYADNGAQEHVKDVIDRGEEDDYEDIHGEVGVVLVAKREGWDPEDENESGFDPYANSASGGMLMGRSFMGPGKKIHLVEVRYDAGWGWKTLPAQGITVTATKQDLNGMGEPGEIIYRTIGEINLSQAKDLRTLVDSVFDWWGYEGIGTWWGPLEMAKGYGKGNRAPSTEPDQWGELPAEAIFGIRTPKEWEYGPMGNEGWVIKPGTPIEVVEAWVQDHDSWPGWRKVPGSGPIRTVAARDDAIEKGGGWLHPDGSIEEVPDNHHDIKEHVAKGWVRLRRYSGSIGEYTNELSIYWQYKMTAQQMATIERSLSWFPGPLYWQHYRGIEIDGEIYPGPSFTGHDPGDVAHQMNTLRIENRMTLEKTAAFMDHREIFYHASQNKMPIGTVLVPQGEGSRTENFDYSDSSPLAGQQGWVYMADDPGIASLFSGISAHYRRGKPMFIYEVLPLGRVREDGGAGTGAFRAERARVTRRGVWSNARADVEWDDEQEDWRKVAAYDGKFEIYRGIPLRLPPLKAKPILEQIARGATTALANVLLEDFATNFQYDKWDGTWIRPTPGAGQWWSTDRSDADAYAEWAGVDASEGFLQIPMVMTAEWSDDQDVKQQGDGVDPDSYYTSRDIAFKMKPGTPIKITKIELWAPTHASAQELLHLIETQGGWVDIHGMADVDKWVYPDPDIQKIHLPIAPMKTTAKTTAPKPGWVTAKVAGGISSQVKEISLMSMEPDENERFRVFVDGYMEDWTLDRIKEAVGNGAILRQWGKSAKLVPMKIGDRVVHRKGLLGPGQADDPVEEAAMRGTVTKIHLKEKGQSAGVHNAWVRWDNGSEGRHPIGMLKVLDPES